MGRRGQNKLDELLEAWVRWCHSGGLVPSHSSSIIANLIDNKGNITFGSGQGQSPIIDSYEAKIEALVMNMANNNQRQADVLRLEYGAGWIAASQRQSMRGYHQTNMGQFEKACALGISVRTYRRYLSAARVQLQQKLGLSYCV